MKDSSEMKGLLLQIKQLEQKRAALSDVEDIKAINKEINALQMEYGQLKKALRNENNFNKSVEREFASLELPDDE
jgi:predicted RNase H-like nuclease (RuvC/YqgF family)